MRIFNVSGDYFISVKNDLPKITDDNSGEARVTECDPFECVNAMNKNDNIEIEHRGKILFTGTTSQTIDGYKVVTITPYRTENITITDPAIVSQSYDYDGEVQSFQLAMPSFEKDKMPIASDTIIYDGKTSSQNKMTYDFNTGIIEIERTV